MRKKQFIYKVLQKKQDEINKKLSQNLNSLNKHTKNANFIVSKYSAVNLKLNSNSLFGIDEEPPNLVTDFTPKIIFSKNL